MRLQRRFVKSLMSFCALAVVVSGTTAKRVGAQGFRSDLQGKIVEVRGDILQVRPQYSTKLTRVVLDEKTEITSPQMTALNSLSPGIVLVCMGDYDDKGGIDLHFIMAMQERTGFFTMKMSGIQAIGYGKSAMCGGKLKSADPLVVIDDDGKEVRPTIKGFVPVMQMQKGDRKALQVGQIISADGDRTTEGLLHARSIEIQQGGGGGAVFGKVVAINTDSIDAKPNFSEDPVTATISAETRLMRQIDVDPDSVKVGDTLTIKGKLAGGTKEAPSALVAAALLLGKQSYPDMGGGGGFMAMMGPGSPTLELTGTVASLSPFVLTLEGGRSLSVTIPGQTPVVDLKIISLTDIKAGEKLMIMGIEGKDGGLLAKTVLVGATPIVGLGG